MKTLFFKHVVAVLACMLFVSCGEPSLRYSVAFPPRPAHWVMLLGEPHWRIEWLNLAGQRQMAEISPHIGLEIELPATWANPVTAWPFWPDKNLPPGFFRPAGAIFPFDAKGGEICLSWEAGPDVIFYRELALANPGNSAKIPANFDWPRFRKLFSTGKLNEDVCQDPWLIDLRGVAESTISGNFLTSRLKAEETEDLAVPVSPGLWYGTSPFAGYLASAQESPPVFPVRPGLNLWFSAEGLLRVNGKTYVFTQW